MSQQQDDRGVAFQSTMQLTGEENPDDSLIKQAQLNSIEHQHDLGEGVDHIHEASEEEKPIHHDEDKKVGKRTLTNRISKFIDSLPLVKSLLGWLACISVHTLFGIHPIISRYLQSQSPNKFQMLIYLTGNLNC